MDEEHTTVVVQRYLDELGGDAPAESAVRALLARRSATLKPSDVILGATLSSTGWALVKKT